MEHQNKLVIIVRKAVSWDSSFDYKNLLKKTDSYAADFL
jgi:hypothetical protein